MGFLPPKKNGGRPSRRGAEISPHDIDELDAYESDGDAEDGDYSPTPAYKAHRPTMQQLSWKCRRHVSRRRHNVSLQFWPDGSVSPTRH